MPNITDWPIYQLSSKRYEFIEEVKNKSIEKSRSHLNGQLSLVEELARTVYQERIRLTQNPWKADPPDEAEFWGDVKRELVKISREEQAPETQQEATLLMNSIISRYSNEIAGTFDPSIYEFAKRAVPFGFSRLLKTSFGQNFKEKLGHQFSVRDRIVLEGDLDNIRELAKNHTLIMVPTHISNLDSMLIGWAIQEIGLPAFIYGAGLNLFGINILAYFMNRLGAYKVDRRKKNLLYLETLKTYSTLAIHKGCHSLFFPGGTRSRSGQIENKLKLGLLGTAMDAQYLNFTQSAEKPRKVIIVPVVMNYHFILEAPNLIEEYLKRSGREFYLMEHADSYSTSLKMARFIIKFLTQTSKIFLSFCPCIDLFGNKVNRAGESIGTHGEKLDIKQYFLSGGKLQEDHQRNEEYVKMLGEEIVKNYYTYNIVMSSHLVGFTAFTILKKRFKKLDIYGLLRLPPEDSNIKYDDFIQAIERVRAEILNMAELGKIKYADHLTRDINAVVEHGLKNIGLYHDMRPLERNKQGDIFSPEIKLLFFYHNRLEGYQLDQFV